MSVLITNHTFVAFDSKTSAAASGQRLAKVLYKTQRGGKIVENARKSICVSIPTFDGVTISDSQLQAFMPHIMQMLENAQDGIVKDRYEAGAISVSDAELSVDSCLAFLDSESRGDRLTKEMIASWFDGSIAEILTVALGEKMQLTDNASEIQLKRLEQSVNVYRDKFCSLAGGRTSFSVEIASKLHKVLELGDIADAMLVRFKNRLEKMMKQEVEMLEAL